MNVIPAVNDINGRMHLDAADFRAGQILLVVDVVNVVVLNDGEDPAQMTHDAGLSAVVNVAAADDMGADVLLRPSLPLCLDDAVSLRLCAVFQFVEQPAVVIFRLQVFAQGDAGALGIGHLAVLNDPAFGPVRPDHPLLISRRRRPLRCRLAHGKAGKGDIADSLP